MRTIRSDYPPPYRHRFDESDFRGYFNWTEEMSDALGPNIYHACHEEQLKAALKAQQLPLRSKWKLKLPQGKIWRVPGVWVGLNYYVRENFFGPLLIKLPIDILNGHQFMAFRRKDGGRWRYFFVQFDSQIPVYTFKKKGQKRELWRNAKAEAYFDTSGGQMIRKPGAIYDIVLTEPIDLDDCTVTSISHPWCASDKKCTGSTASAAEKSLVSIARREARRVIRRSAELQACLRRFPCLEGQQVTLKRRERSLRRLAIA